MPKKLRQSALSDREYTYWITKNCSRTQCWIAVARIDDILSHRHLTLYHNFEQVPIIVDTVEMDKLIVAAQAKTATATATATATDIDAVDEIRRKCQLDANRKALGFSKLTYVYTVRLDENRFSALLSDETRYYCIDNVLTDTHGYESTIYIIDNLDKVCQYIPTKLRSRLKLVKPQKAKLHKRDIIALKQIVSVDFIGRNDQQQQFLWKKYVAQAANSEKKTLDLSGLLMISDKNLELELELDVEVSGIGIDQIKTIVLYQNNKIKSFDWLKQFTNLKTLSIWYFNMLSDNDIYQITEATPKLESLELHSCFGLTGRCLIPISKLNLLNRLMLDNPRMSCQENTYTTVIGPKEWAKLSNSSLELIMINSDNVTLDFVSYLLASFKGITRLVLGLIVLNKIKPNMSNGYEKESVIFQAFEDPKTGYKLHKTVRSINLLKDQYDDEPFSKSMLEVIKRQNPEMARAYTGTVEGTDEVKNE